MEEISDLLLNQRIRNRIIEVLEITTSYEEQEKHGGDEVINMWEDWVDDERIGDYVEPVFTKKEQERLAEFHKAWNYVSNHTPQFLPDISELKKNNDWTNLMASASDALAVFRQRGKLSEESEIT